MTTVPAGAPIAETSAEPARGHKDRRGSWVPTLAMISTRMMELRKRRGLMSALIIVNVGIPGTFLIVRLLLHAFAPKSYGPAGGYDVFTALIAGVMYVFGFIVAAVVGCAAGSVDLTDGMFRHLVVTGRSRLALFLARIPAGLAIVLPIVASGIAVVCAVCVLAAPKVDNFDGVNMPAGLSLTSFEQFAATHPNEVVCNFNIFGPISPNVQQVVQSAICGPNQFKGPGPGPATGRPSPAQIRAAAVTLARLNYSDYASKFLSPPTSLMIDAGLWLLLEATIGFIVGLGLSSLLGQRTIAVVLMIVLELILTPIVSRARIPHMINVQRGFVGLAMAHIEPPGLPLAFGGGMNSGGSRAMEIRPESTEVAIIVIVAWLVVWTVIGARRMMTRDA